MSHGLDPQNQQVELQPSLAELFRTCIHPPVLLLRIDHVEREHTREGLKESHNSRDREDNKLKGRTARYFLTDGKLLIQALLHRKISHLSESRDVLPGDFLEIYKFDVKKARRVDGEGHVVYLGIKDCQFISAAIRVSRDSSTTVASEVREPKIVIEKAQRHAKHSSNQDEDYTAGGFFREDVTVDAQSISKKRKIDQLETAAGTADRPMLSSGTGLVSDHRQAASRAKSTKMEHEKPTPKSVHLRHLTPLKSSSTRPSLDTDSDDEDAFETISLDETTARKRRRALHELSQTTVSSLDHRSVSKIAPLSRTSSSRSALLEMTRTDELHGINQRTQISVKDVSTSSQSSRPVSAHQSTNPQDKQALKLPDPEPPFHNLHSILYPPTSAPLPRKNYTFTTLAIITYIGPSLITKPNTPFPPKRHIKIEDPTLHLHNHIHKDQTSNNNTESNHVKTSNTEQNTPSSFPDKRGKRITVAIYQDAATFKPAFGTLALFRGLVMQRLSNGDVVLNVYPRSRRKLHSTRSCDGDIGRNQSDMLGVDDKSLLLRSDSDHHDRVTLDGLDKLDSDETLFREGEWFITDQVRLRKMGFDVDGLASWWDERVKELKLSK